jgi:hypothetical protein
MTIYGKEMNKKTCRRRNERKQGENFIGRIGERGARSLKEERGDEKRKSKDKGENAEGKRLMELIEENGWKVLNKNKQEDEERE